MKLLFSAVFLLMPIMASAAACPMGWQQQQEIAAAPCPSHPERAAEKQPCSHVSLLDCFEEDALAAPPTVELPQPLKLAAAIMPAAVQVVHITKNVGADTVRAPPTYVPNAQTLYLTTQRLRI